MKAHLETTCVCTLLRCTRCNLLKSRGELEQDDHNCDIELLKAADQSEAEKLKTKLIEQLILQVNTLNSKIERQNDVIK